MRRVSPSICYIAHVASPSLLSPLLQLSEAMGLQVTRTELLPAFVKLLQVRAWRPCMTRFRGRAAAKRGVPPRVNSNRAIPLPLPCFRRHAQDPEAEVRASAAKNVAPYAALVGHERFLSDLLPAVRDCVVDAAQNVRTAIGESLMTVASTLEHDAAVGSVVPLILQCLRDEAPEVRLTVLESLSKITHTLGAPFLESAVLPTLQKLGEDPLWRVREQVIQQMPLLAGVLVRGGVRRRASGACSPSRRTRPAPLPIPLHTTPVRTRARPCSRRSWCRSTSRRTRTR